MTFYFQQLVNCTTNFIIIITDHRFIKIVNSSEVKFHKKNYSYNTPVSMALDKARTNNT